MTSIGDYAFQSCTDLEYVYVLPTTPPTIGYNPFNACPDGLQIAVPAQLLKTYKEAENWSGYAAKMVGVLNETTGFDNTFAKATTNTHAPSTAAWQQHSACRSS